MRRIVAAWACWLACGLGCWGAGDPAITNEADGGIEFKIQGEYVGVVEADGMRWGGQVIALGDGSFHCVGYPGGLPGDGWSAGSEKNEIDGKLDGNKAVFQAESFKLVADGETLQVIDTEGGKLGQLKKVQRESPTLGAKPPADAIVLFDGTGVEAWDNGKLVEEKYLGATNCKSKQKFGDHQIHLEFRTPFMAKSRGQGRGNSGMYVHGRYEVQVLDSFGLEGLDNECGGIYSMERPRVNMCFPPLSWQTYDVDFKAPRYDDQGKKTQNARITLRHNGVLIYDNVELPKATPGNENEAPSPGGLFLQDHGNPVVFRNIWIVEKK